MAKQSIRKSLARTLLILAIGPLAVLGTVLTWHSYNIQKQQAIDFQIEVSKRAAQEIYRPIEELQNDFISAANIHDVVNLTYPERDNLLKRLRSHTNDMLRNIVTELTIADRTGKELNKISFIEIYTEEDLGDLSQEEQFTYPFTKGKVYYSPIWLDEETGDPRMTMGVPWHNVRSMHIEAVLIAELRLKELWNEAMEIRTGTLGNTYIIDGQGRLVAHDNPSLVLRGTEFHMEHTSGFQTGLLGDMASLASTIIELGDQKLYIVTEQPVYAALGLTIDTVATIIACMIIALLLSITIGYAMVHRMILPIESLAETASAITSGDLTRRADVIRDDEVALLARAFNSMTSRLVHTIGSLEKNISRINHMAHYDRLTGLPNRRLLESSLNKTLSESTRHKYFGALIFFDLDHFKTINDSLGHPIGDELLKQVGKRLSSEVRTEDTVARLGGDEFVVVLKQISRDIDGAAQNARLVAEKIRLELAEPYELDNAYYRITASIGVAMFPHINDTANDILKHADTAMYRSKDTGRNNIHFYRPDMQIAVTERLTLEKDLHDAISQNNFLVYFQPEISDQGEVIGVESLLRWPTAQGQLLSPQSFIELAEETGLIIPIGNWVLETSCMKFQQWNNKNKNFLKHISVNISYRQFHQEDFVKQVTNTLAKTGVSPDRLKLEITESILMSDIEDAIEKMATLKSLGIKFSIDDFGTGYSSLSYLSRLPLDILKIDQSFVRNLPYHKDGAAIVETIIAMANNLNLEVIAEGVETESQFKFLQDKGCGSYQGYLFSKPLTENQLMEFVSDHNEKYRLSIAASASQQYH